ncbi:hypothetical protein CH381_10830 [Leptospira sp. mixed culture ATI2-C-A1]|nr:hypothetical protein CH381_10830 [Leptospira sp. mixed culture ATI2-C-A1]
MLSHLICRLISKEDFFMKLSITLFSLFVITSASFAICPGKEKRSCPGHDKLVECPHDGK